MPTLSQSIITNVDANYIEVYLKRNGFFRSEENAGQDLKYWVDDLLNDNRLKPQEFEEFLFEELFWGKRKTIQIYKLDKIKNYKYPTDWEKPLEEKYGRASLNFSDILNSIPNGNESRKIAAIQSKENAKGELVKLQILFVCYIQINSGAGYADSVSYVPVEIDFIRKIMIIKAWTRQKIAHEDHKADALMLHIKDLISVQFKVLTKKYMSKHKKVLFYMSKSLIDEAYSHVPTYNQVGKINDGIKNFVKKTLEKLPLRNLVVDENGNYYLPDGVMQFEAEIRNVIEALAVSDYFFEKDFEEIWEMGLEAVVARIKFNDKENVLTSLSGENTETPIFCTKTFMSLKNRMEETEKIETLWITMDRKKGNLNLKFDATNEEYLGILVRYGIKFNETDMGQALGIYEKYESKINQKSTTEGSVAIGQ